MTRKDKVYNCFKKSILRIAELKYPLIRKRKYYLHYYLDKFLLLLNDMVSWKSLKHTYNYYNKREFHWKSIYNEYNRWAKDNIFEEAYIKFMNDNYFKL
jgi:hypothetical protein